MGFSIKITVKQRQLLNLIKKNVIMT